MSSKNIFVPASRAETELLLDLTIVIEAFDKVFNNHIDEDPTAIPVSEINDVIKQVTEHGWDGSTSDDPTALSRVEVNDATETEWDGSTSDDPTAMTSNEIERATT